MARSTTMKIHYPDQDDLPGDNSYVLAWVPSRPWNDSHDPEGLRFWRVLKFQRGITQAEREALPYRDKRKKIFRGCDEWDNNKCGYNWQEFGPGSYFGQEVKAWIDLSELNQEAQSHGSFDSD